MAALRSSGTWGSALTTDEFAAIRSVGFEPVGQVFGAAVHAAPPGTRYGCPGAGTTQVSGPGEAGSLGPLVQVMNHARHNAIDRMITECTELGGHGVVGVRVSRGAFPLGGHQFTVIGTAVRAPGAAPGLAPFTCDLSGQDFAKLIAAAWVPVGLVLGISIGSRHDDRDTTRQARWSSGNTEVDAWTDLVGQSRHDARRQLERDVGRLGAEGVVIAAMQLRVRQRDCPETTGRRDHVAEATLIGTAVTRFGRTERRQGQPALAIMSLDQRPGRDARIRI
jgi:uncharacterized protein YbjQ (UPF0145 family)